MSDEQLLKISDVTVEYVQDQVKITALDRVSLNIPSNYTLGIVGESGSGKTTLGMAIMNRIEPPGRIKEGNIEYMGKNVFGMDKKELLSYRWEEVSMVYQSAMNSLNPVKEISHPIIEVLVEHKKVSKQEARKIALTLLEQVGIGTERANNYPHEFSGGMRQRVVIALAIALSPKLLVADEPTSALDVITQKQILALLKTELLKRNGTSMLFITHEIALLPGLVDNIAVMFSGEIVELGSLEDVLHSPLHPYTEMLLGTILKMHSKLSDSYMTPLKRSRRSASENLCKYVDRCKYAFQRCSEERPKLLEVGKGRRVSCHKYD